MSPEDAVQSVRVSQHVGICMSPSAVRPSLRHTLFLLNKYRTLGPRSSIFAVHVGHVQ